MAPENGCGLGGEAEVEDVDVVGLGVDCGDVAPVQLVPGDAHDFSFGVLVFVEDVGFVLLPGG